MTTLGIGHDYAHCEGTNCALKEKCIRYLLHLDSVRCGLTYVTYVFPEFKEGHCKNFWEHYALAVDLR